MKPLGRFSRIAAYGMALATVAFASSTQAAEGSAIVGGVRGTAQYSVAGGDWQTLSQGAVLKPGATLNTGINSQIDLSLGANGGSVSLLDGTKLALDKLNRERTGIDVVFETFLDLQTGTIQGKVKKFSPSSKYEVKTPHTIVGIKGDEDTEYQISADGKASILKGSAVVAYTNPSTGAVSTSSVGGRQTFVPPIDPATAAPQVRPTGSGDVTPQAPVIGGPGGPAAPIAVVTEPVQFVSPGTGRPASSSGGQ